MRSWSCQPTGFMVFPDSGPHIWQGRFLNFSSTSKTSRPRRKIPVLLHPMLVGLSPLYSPCPRCYRYWISSSRNLIAVDLTLVLCGDLRLEYSQISVNLADRLQACRLGKSLSPIHSSWQHQSPENMRRSYLTATLSSSAAHLALVSP